jgi:hypothetical protein
MKYRIHEQQYVGKIVFYYICVSIQMFAKLDCNKEPVLSSSLSELPIPPQASLPLDLSLKSPYFPNYKRGLPELILSSLF